MSEEGTQAPAAESAPQGGSDLPAGKSYTPDEIERIIAGRVNRAVSKFSDYEEIKTKAARADELEQASQSDMDKLRSKAEREAEKRAAAEDKASKAADRAEKALKRAAIVSAAAQANAADPGDVFTLLMASDKASSISITDDGDVEGAVEAVAEYLKGKPNLLKRAGGFDGGRQGGSSPTGHDMNHLIRAAAGISPAQ